MSNQDDLALAQQLIDAGRLYEARRVLEESCQPGARKMAHDLEAQIEKITPPRRRAPVSLIRVFIGALVFGLIGAGVAAIALDLKAGGIAVAAIIMFSFGALLMFRIRGDEDVVAREVKSPRDYRLWFR